MSARDELFLWIDDSLSTEMASQLIDAYAHELAERIRESAGPSKPYPHEKSVHPVVIGMHAGANLIDPEVNDERT